MYDKIIGFYSRPNSLPIGVLIFILVLVNYSLESLKWCAILKPLEEFSFWKALKSVLVGVLFSIFTPARIGELGGRVIELKKENRLVGTAAVLVGSVAQNIGILFLGLFGLIWFVYANNMAERLIFLSMLIITIFLFFIAILCYFNINRFIPFAKNCLGPKE
ncbi:MAG: flippase-like domain-containing protein [Saprospiraceae bacterium]|nr:lysylphosphatidylglycerol synthase domain-containing protein [Candidatus Brachybacter algidus]MBL0117772.1 flippase-like domain-containing protein [Candidatus Brachybacter algidus]